MTSTNLQGPVNALGPSLSPTFGSNPQAAPSTFFQGVALRDPLTYPGTGHLRGFCSGLTYTLIDVAPAAMTTTAIAAAQSGVGGTALTLVSASGAGIVVGANVFNGVNNVTNASGVAITALAIQVAYGDIYSSATQGTAPQFFDPTKSLARNVRVTYAGTETTITGVRVAGYDLYGVLTSEDFGNNAGVAGTVSGKKAFKYIVSATPLGTGTSAGNISVGTGDVFGFPMLSSGFEYVSIFYNSALITSTTGYVAPDVTNPATRTTGDVRGTYAVQSATDGTKKLVVTMEQSVANALAATPSSLTSIYGQVQA